MKCKICKLPADKMVSGVIDGKFISDRCEICFGKLKQQQPASSTRKDYRLRRQQEDHRADIAQPYKDGKINRDFINIYPDKAPQYFSKEELRKAERS